MMNNFWQDNWLTILVITVMVGGYLLLRTQGDDLASTTVFDTQVTGGDPTLVEFYSNT